MPAIPTTAMHVAKDRPSSVFVGRGENAEKDVAELCDGAVHSFFAHAQRCVWGTSQPDLVRVNVASTLARWGRRHPEHFAVALLEAFLYAGDDPERAHSARDRAIELAPEDHPWAFLLPRDEEWNHARPQPQLEEVVRGQVWRIRGSVCTPHSAFGPDSYATVLRTEGGRLLYVNPVELPVEVEQQIRDLGDVGWIASQGRAHSRHVEEAAATFREARVLGTGGHLKHPPSRHLKFDGLLDDTESARLPAEILALPIEGTEADEVVLLHRPTGLLVMQDLLSNNTAGPGAPSFAGRIEYFAFGVIDRIGMMSYHPMLWHDLGRFQASLRAVVEAPFDRAAGAHWARIEHGAGIREALLPLTNLTTLEHRRMLLRYFWHQPGFLVDLLRYRFRIRRR